MPIWIRDSMRIRKFGTWVIMLRRYKMFLNAPSFILVFLSGFQIDWARDETNLFLLSKLTLQDSDRLGKSRTQGLPFSAKFPPNLVSFMSTSRRVIRILVRTGMYLVHVVPNPDIFRSENFRENIRSHRSHEFCVGIPDPWRLIKPRKFII
jgi:hypothetical protein